MFAANFIPRWKRSARWLEQANVEAAALDLPVFQRALRSIEIGYGGKRWEHNSFKIETERMMQHFFGGRPRMVTEAARKLPEALDMACIAIELLHASERRHIETLVANGLRYACHESVQRERTLNMLKLAMRWLRTQPDGQAIYTKARAHMLEEPGAVIKFKRYGYGVVSMLMEFDAKPASGSL